MAAGYGIALCYRKHTIKNGQDNNEAVSFRSMIKINSMILADGE